MMNYHTEPHVTCQTCGQIFWDTTSVPSHVCYQPTVTGSDKANYSSLPQAATHIQVIWLDDGTKDYLRRIAEALEDIAINQFARLSEDQRKIVLEAQAEEKAKTRILRNEEK